MRRAALHSCLSAAAKEGEVIGLEGYDLDAKTKTFMEFLTKLPVDVGRKIVFVLPAHMEALERGARNVPGVKTILAQYLNPEDILGAHHLIFLVDALRVAEEMFGKAVIGEQAHNSQLTASQDDQISATKASS
jgi:large subunit ribosomal protein L4